ncbi:MAG: TGS domain-containing protein [Calditrichaeota bacterium]|nr:MAG: TGS domain-containing protein [Calditrichota bacterium]
MQCKEHLKFEFWAYHVRKVLEELSHMGKFRGDASLFKHMLTVGKRIYETFCDLEMAKAGYLFPLDTTLLSTYQNELQITPNMLSILKDCEKLRSLNVRDEDVEQHYRRYVLPEIKNERSIALFIFVKLYQIDPEGKMREWTKKYHSKPIPFEPDWISPRLYDPELKDWEVWYNFYQKIVINTASFFGFWLEKIALENGILFHYKRDQFMEVVNCSIEMLNNHLFRNDSERLRVEFSKHFMVLGIKEEDINWEWRHVASTLRRLERVDREDWMKHMDRFGYFTIKCKDEETCYRALYILHQKFNHQPGKLKDYIGEPSRGLYKAIHTIINPERALAPSFRALKIRILPISIDEIRYNEMIADTLVRVKKILFSGQPEAQVESHSDFKSVSSRENILKQIKVFAPDGRPVVLPLGSTVLDFAYSIKFSFLAHLKGALVNGHEVDLLHPLNHGDIVNLKLARELVPLPLKLLSKINAIRLKEEKSREEKRLLRIFKEFRRYYRPALIDQGRNWLLQKLREQGVVEIDDQKLFDTFIEEAAFNLKKNFNLTVTEFPKYSLGKSWLYHLGVYASYHKGILLGYDIKLLESMVNRFVDELVKIIEKKVMHLMYELQFPKNDGKRIRELKLCKECNASLSRHLVGKEKDGIWMLHTSGFPCGQGGIPVTLQRHVTPPQYIVIYFNNRIGIGAEILQTCAGLNIDIIEIAGIRVNRGEGVIRIRVDYINRELTKTLMRELQKIHGVKSVLGPDDPPNAAYENMLPIRRGHIYQELVQPPPYWSGDSIKDDNFFYGMEEELAQLRESFASVTHPLRTSQKHSRTVLICGPKRIGKSSLALKFARELEHIYTGFIFKHYYEAPSWTTWGMVETELKKRLIKEAQQIARGIGAPLSLSEELPLLKIIEIIKEKISPFFVLMLDEITAVLAQTNEISELDKFVEFYTGLKSGEGNFIVLVGHDATLNSIPSHIYELLAKCEQVRLKGLSPEETLDLLRAKKLETKYHIQVSKGLAKRIHRETGGNPFWISRIALRMWKSARERKSGIVHYTSKLFEKSLLELMESGLEFIDKVDFILDDQLDMKILQVLANFHERNSFQEGMDCSTIHSVLNKDGVRVSLETIKQHLKKLSQIGTVVLKESKKSGSQWFISAPILIRYINFKGKMVGEQKAGIT